MEPIPETREAIDELEPLAADDDHLDQLVEKSRRVQELVPDCLGLSLASTAHGITFTLVASAAEIAVLDAVQYLAGGPCLEPVNEPQVVEFNRPTGAGDETGLFDETRWQLFSEATAAKGVQSTLTLPIMRDTEVIGTLNLYGGSRRAFADLHDEIADIFDAWAEGAVTNADLSFTTRLRAQEAPARIRAAAKIETAAGILSAMRGVDDRTARETLRDAAARAGVNVLQIAEVIIELHRDPE
jgi:GAF domain-containing protein